MACNTGLGLGPVAGGIQERTLLKRKGKGPKISHYETIKAIAIDILKGVPTREGKLKGLIHGGRIALHWSVLQLKMKIFRLLVLVRYQVIISELPFWK